MESSEIYICSSYKPNVSMKIVHSATLSWSFSNYDGYRSTRSRFYYTIYIILYYFYYFGVNVNFNGQ